MAAGDIAVQRSLPAASVPLDPVACRRHSVFSKADSRRCEVCWASPENLAFGKVEPILTARVGTRIRFVRRRWASVFLNCPSCGAAVEFASEDAMTDVACPDCGNPVSATVTCGLTIGDYRLRAPLGSGGMARVFLADQISLKREVALKVLHLQHLSEEDRLEQFLEEARTAAQLNHPGIVQIYALGEEGGVHYFAMELVPGASVKQILENGPLDVDWSLMVVEKVAKALSYAWKRNKLVHRDIKPDNIMIREDGEVKLADLGLAASVHEIRDDEVIEGSPHYIAPEPVRGDTIDFRSDMYSLGATLYHMVTGSFPFVGNSLAETVFMHMDAKLEPPNERNPEVPLAVSNLVCRMMAKNPADRFASYEELIQKIDSLRTGTRSVPGPQPSEAAPADRATKPKNRCKWKWKWKWAVVAVLVASVFSIWKSEILDTADAGRQADAVQLLPTANSIPVAVDLSEISLARGQQVEITLVGSDADGDALTYQIITPPTKGLLTGEPPELTYVPAADAEGKDSFTYRVNDGRSVSNTASVSLQISGNDYLLTPVADAFLDGTNNSGFFDVMVVKKRTHGREKGVGAFMRFELPDVSRLNSATLRLRTTGETVGARSVGIRRTVDDFWPEENLNYGNAPRAETAPMALFEVRPNAFVEIDLTNVVRDALAGNKKLSILLNAQDSIKVGALTAFCSKEHENPEFHPVLILKGE